MTLACDPRYMRVATRTHETSSPTCSWPPFMSIHPYTPYHKNPSSHGTQTGLGASGCGNAVRDTSIPYAQSYWPTESTSSLTSPGISRRASTFPRCWPRRPRMYTPIRACMSMSASPPPALLVWLAREFDLAGEAFSSPMTCLVGYSVPTTLTLRPDAYIPPWCFNTPPAPSEEPGVV